MDSVILSALIVAVLGPYFLQKYTRHADSRSLAKAIAGEISGILHIVEKRQYREDLRKLIDRFKDAPDLQDSTPWFTFSVRHNPLAVYDANIAKLGTLPGDLVRDISHFYSLAHAILSDIADMDPRQPGSHLARVGAEAIAHLEQVLDLMEQAHSLGRSLVARIEVRSEGWWTAMK